VKIGEEKKPIVMIFAIVVIVISLFSIMKTGRGSRPKVDMDRFESLGQFAAEETVNFLGAGKQVVIISMEAGDAKALKRQQKAYIETLEKGDVTVAAVEAVGTDPGEMPMMMMEMGLMTISDYNAIVEKHSEVDAFISLVGMPMQQMDAPNRLSESAPPLIIAQSMGMMMGVADYLRAGTVTMAIMPRIDVSVEEEEPKTHREWFDRYFQVVTAEDADSIPYY